MNSRDLLKAYLDKKAVTSSQEPVTRTEDVVIPPIVQAKEVSASVEVGVKHASGEEQTIKDESFAQEIRMYEKKPLSYLSIELGMTVNLGNYNNGRVKASVTVPVGVPLDEKLQKEMAEAFTFGKTFVEGKVREEARRLMEFAKRQQ